LPAARASGIRAGRRSSARPETAIMQCRSKQQANL
jgi:hypothetical protein